MCPNIIIGEVMVSSWYAMLILGAIVSTILAVFLRPRDFPLARLEILAVAVMMIAGGLFGARLLFILLHYGTTGFRFSDLFSISGGFAYFGSLAISIPLLWAYSALRRVSLLSLLDYAMPFLMLSQVFVRIGCFMAGCCHGSPTGMFFGVVFKVAGNMPRHPTQIYEAVLLAVIYLIGRSIYKKNSDNKGCTFFTSLAIYAGGRFIIESFRVDSPTVFLNLTLAQLTCLGLVMLSVFALDFRRRCVPK